MGEGTQQFSLANLWLSVPRITNLEYQLCPKILYMFLLVVKRKNKFNCLYIKFKIKRLDYFFLRQLMKMFS